MINAELSHCKTLREWYESIRIQEGQGRFPTMNEVLRGITIEEWVRCEQEPKFDTPQKLMNAK